MKPRHHVYLDDELTERLDALAAKPGSSKSSIVADALKSYLGRRAARELDDLLKVRLDRFGNQLGRIERDQQVLMESLALFIRYQFMVTAPVPEAEQATARAAAQERFQAFIDQVGRRLAAGKRTAADMVAKITPDGVSRTPVANTEAAE
jgi:predicted transcriptional regulator